MGLAQAYIEFCKMLSFCYYNTASGVFILHKL